MVAALDFYLIRLTLCIAFRQLLTIKAVSAPWLHWYYTNKGKPLVFETRLYLIYLIA